MSDLIDAADMGELPTIGLSLETVHLASGPPVIGPSMLLAIHALDRVVHLTLIVPRSAVGRIEIIGVENINEVIIVLAQHVVDIAGFIIEDVVVSIPAMDSVLYGPTEEIVAPLVALDKIASIAASNDIVLVFAVEEFICAAIRR